MIYLNTLWKDLLLCQLNLMLISNDGLAFFRQNKTLSEHKT